MNSRDRAIFVLSGHLMEGTEGGETATEQEEDVEEETAGRGRLLGKLFDLLGPAGSCAGASQDGQSKGGLCTQSLLFALRGGGRPHSSVSTSLTFAELLEIMLGVVIQSGFPSAVFTVRSCLDLAAGGETACISSALPHASRCRCSPRVLQVGICYTELPEWRLAGSWNDVLDLQGWLVSQLGWPTDSFRVLTDREGSDDILPTRQNILDGILWLLDDGEVEPQWPDRSTGSCCRLLQFCGHGEKSELFPLDWLTHGSISDSELSSLVTSSLCRGETFTCILDCCHSSTLFRGLAFDLQAIGPAAQWSP